MSDLLQRIYDLSPTVVQNAMVTIENHRSLRRRRQGAYSRWRQFFAYTEYLPHAELTRLQNKRLQEFLTFAIQNSPWHRARLLHVDPFRISVENLASLPMMSKEDLRSNAETIATLPRHEAYVAKTGGTTGAALEVLYRWDDFQERTAMLDHFRGRFIRTAQPRTAWFSGKALVPQASSQTSYWRTNWLDRIRYYSTFHINSDTVEAYLEDLRRFRPHVMVGFPSSMIEIARCAELRGLRFDGSLEAIFPTAETVDDDARELLRRFYGCGVFDQYASSEGAPFITECPSGNLHLEPLTGVFEILDDRQRPAREGELVVTAFGTRGTPLIRYRIEDRVVASEEGCTCGRSTPVIERIDGRPNDFVFSPVNGRINLGNISNSVKGVHGIKKFQIVQSVPDKILVILAIDREHYTENDERILIRNLRDRLGEAMSIDIEHKDDISRERSGKHRIVKNMLNQDDLDRMLLQTRNIS